MNMLEIEQARREWQDYYIRGEAGKRCLVCGNGPDCAIHSTAKFTPGQRIPFHPFIDRANHPIAQWSNQEISSNG
jgi:hypothetical protein